MPVPELTAAAIPWLLEEDRGGLTTAPSISVVLQPRHRGVSWAKGGCRGGRSSLPTVPTV